MATYIQAKSGIYKIVNNTNNKVYVGCASNIKTRINGHLHSLRKGSHANDYLQKSWNKYGESSFLCEVIEFCNIEDLHHREHFWVTFMGCLNKKIGYNIKPTDPNGCSVISEETKEKLRQVNKGKKPSDLCIQKLKERTLSEEHKEALRLGRLSVNYSKLHREKRGKKVMDDITGIIYNSLAELSDLIGVPKFELSRRLTGKRKNNTTFKYI